jgi:hypothetical protein
MGEPYLHNQNEKINTEDANLTPRYWSPAVSDFNLTQANLYPTVFYLNPTLHYVNPAQPNLYPAGLYLIPTLHSIICEFLCWVSLRTETEMIFARHFARISASDAGRGKCHTKKRAPVKARVSDNQPFRRSREYTRTTPQGPLCAGIQGESPID